jgi:hypothetical protein
MGCRREFSKDRTARRRVHIDPHEHIEHPANFPDHMDKLIITVRLRERFFLAFLRLLDLDPKIGPVVFQEPVSIGLYVDATVPFNDMNKGYSVSEGVEFVI